MLRCTLILVATVLPCVAEDPAKAAPSKASADSPVASQQKAVAEMAPSLAAQRAAIARQVGQKSSESFFLLDPPSSTGLVPGQSLSTSAPSSAAAVSPIRSPGIDCDPVPAEEISPIIEGAAKRESLQPELLRSVVQQESGFRPCAVSPKGAMGLMQLMPATAVQLGVKDPFDPKENVDAGAHFLKQLLNLYNDLPTALGAYNAGPGRVNEAGGVPQIPETLNYIQRILSLLPARP